MWDAIWDILTMPYDEWTGIHCSSSIYGDGEYCYQTEPDKLTAIFGGFLVSCLVLVVLVLAVMAIIGISGWLKKSYRHARYAVPCQHAECGHRQTVETGKGEPGCIGGAPCCGNCSWRHHKDALHRQANDEPKRQCMHGHGNMQKIIMADTLVIDECAVCHSVWLDRTEMAKVKEMSYDDGYSAGRSAASAQSSSNFAVGMMIGSSMN